jgi:hypothetical protein
MKGYFMKIIEHGNPEMQKSTKTFVCPACGCKFIANKNEYKTSHLYNGEYISSSYCECPECDNIAYEED